MEDNFKNNFSHLQDFSLEPSAKIWVEVEKKLPQEKKRRILGWWWSVPAIVIIGFGVVWFANFQSKNIKVTENKKEEILVSNIDGKIKNNETQALIKPEISKETKAKNINATMLEARVNNSLETINISKSIEKKKSLFKEKRNNKINKALSLNTNSEQKPRLKKSIKSVKQKDENFILVATENLDKNKITDALVSEIKEKNSLNVTEELKEISKPKIEQKTSETKKATTIIAEKKEAKKSKKINFSLTAFTGINYVSDKNIFGYNTNNSDLNITMPNSGTGGGSGLSGNPASANIDDVKIPDKNICLGLGVNANYEINKKSSINLGLQYEYNSTIIKAQPIATASFSLNDRLNRLNDFTNQFHLISLPVSYQYTFNPNAKNKISAIIGGGINIALTKNCLVINETKTGYQDNNDELNTLLFNSTIGLNYSINNKISVELLATKYLTSVQKITSKYYWQQINFQIKIPLTK